MEKAGRKLAEYFKRTTLTGWYSEQKRLSAARPQADARGLGSTDGRMVQGFAEAEVPGIALPKDGDARALHSTG